MQMLPRRWLDILICNDFLGQVACQLSEHQAPLRWLIQDYIRRIRDTKSITTVARSVRLRDMDDRNASMCLLGLYTIALEAIIDFKNISFHERTWILPFGL